MTQKPLGLRLLDTNTCREFNRTFLSFSNVFLVLFMDICVAFESICLTFLQRHPQSRYTFNMKRSVRKGMPDLGLNPVPADQIHVLRRILSERLKALPLQKRNLRAQSQFSVQAPSRPLEPSELPDLTLQWHVACEKLCL